MEKDVIISIRGLQNLAHSGEEDKFELITAGRLRRCNGAYTLEYDETDLTGMKGTKTAFEIAPERIILMRTGDINSQMVFEQGRRHLSLYELAEGSLSVGVNTRKLRVDIGDDGGELEFRYGLEIDQAEIGENAVHLTVRIPQ